MVCGFATDAMAAGFYLPGRGIRPLGRAGAYVAGSEGNLNALWYNPANLAKMDHLQLTVDLGLIPLDFDYTRAPRTMPNGDIRTYDTVSNMAPPKVDPQVLIGGPLPWKGLVWAFGIYAPYLSGHTFPEDGAQRYVLIDNDRSLLGFFHLAVAWNIGDHFQLGAGFQNVPADFVLVNMATGYTGLFGDPEDPNLDILTRIELKDFFAPTGNAGVTVGLSDWLSAALSFQGPVVFSDKDAKLTSRLPSHPESHDAKINGDSVAGNIKFPPVARAALRLKRPSFDVEVDGVWEGWSILKEIKANPNDVSVSGLPGLDTVPVGPLTVPMEWQDTYSVRVGGDVDFSDSFTGRLGYAYETNAIPDRRYTVFIADAKKHMMAVGASFHHGGFTLDGSFAYYLMPDRTITNSQWRQIDPTDNEGKVTLIVGNGTYHQRYMAFGLGATFEL